MMQLEPNAKIVGVKDIVKKDGTPMRMIFCLKYGNEKGLYGAAAVTAWAFEGSDLIAYDARDLVDHICLISEINGKAAIMAVDDGEE